MPFRTNEVQAVPTLSRSSPEEDDTKAPFSPESPYGEKQLEASHVADVQHVSAGPTIKDAHNSVGLALIEQGTAIPQTGERLVTTKWEYWMYIVYCESNDAPTFLRVSPRV